MTIFACGTTVKSEGGNSLWFSSVSVTTSWYRKPRITADGAPPTRERRPLLFAGTPCALSGRRAVPPTWPRTGHVPPATSTHTGSRLGSQPGLALMYLAGLRGETSDAG